ncbi:MULTISPECIES: lysophospholipid acyltransferase family protein [unclassified Actinobaculum]|uniref:lysophospholipid acyltransferase family protein n=1 Tax=unclassified Actinobaculum TaxID=2609299 RepID=UPI0013DE6C89|nr:MULTISPECIES: lysophospholipid acyltransferase family protein [unclassified Actinobaculum]
MLKRLRSEARAVDEPSCSALAAVNVAALRGGGVAEDVGLFSRLRTRCAHTRLAWRSRRGQRPGPLVMRLVAPPLVALTHAIQDMRVDGAATLPTGPLLVVANHTCHLDALTVGVALYEAGIAPHFAARADLFRVPVVGWILRRMGQIPVHRSDDGEGDAAAAMTEMAERLQRGECVVVFPEGTFTRDPEKWPMRAKTGAARLALRFPGVPVVGLAHWGNEGLIDPWTGKVAWQRLGRQSSRLDVRFTAPLNLKQFWGSDATYELLTDMTESMMTTITDELALLRSEDPASAGLTPRKRRWDRTIDGDPYRVQNARNKARRRRAERRRARLLLTTGLLGTSAFLRRIRDGRRGN